MSDQPAGAPITPSSLPPGSDPDRPRDTTSTARHIADARRLCNQAADHVTAAHPALAGWFRTAAATYDGTALLVGPVQAAREAIAGADSGAHRMAEDLRQEVERLRGVGLMQNKSLIERIDIGVQRAEEVDQIRGMLCEALDRWDRERRARFIAQGAHDHPAAGPTARSAEIRRASGTTP